MTQSNIKATFSCDIKKIWDIVTSLDHYQWRTDINRIEIIEPHKVFIEYTHVTFQHVSLLLFLNPIKDMNLI